MAKKKKKTPAAVSRAAVALNRARWASIPAKKRTEIARKAAQHPRGTRNPDRCPCGKMTRERALKRGHKCQEVV